MNFHSGGIAAAFGLCLMLAASPAARAESLRVCDDVVEPASLDPLKSFSEKNYTILQQIFDGLVRFDPEGRIVPALAASWKRIDPLTVEFALREGVRFHDGEPFDAESVRYTLERYIDPRTGFPGAGLLNSIEKAEVVDPATIRVRTRFPDGLLLHRLAGYVSMLPPRAIARLGREQFGARPVGTGPFRFARWEAGKRIVLEANPEYRLPAPPRFEALEFLFLAADAQTDALLEGQVDIVTELPGTETLRVTKSGKAGVVKRPTFYTVASSVNVSSGPLADRRVRRALNHAIDREALVRFDVRGNGRPLASLTMPGEIGHDPELKPYPYDPAKARRLLAEAGYPSGLRLSVVVKAQGERTMRILSAQLKKVGIELESRLTTDADVIRDIQSRPWDFTFGGCPDPIAHSFFIQSIFLSSLSPYSVTRDPEYDRRLEGMVTSLDPAEQDRAGRELDRYVHDEALSVFTYQRVKTYGVRRGIVFVPSVTGMPYFNLSHPDESSSKARAIR